MATLGVPLSQDIERSEDDTDDIIIHLTDSAGADIDVTGWTAILSIGTDADTLLTGSQATYNGTGVAADGLISIDMNPFNVPQGSYKYDIRVTDTVTGDTPARVYVKGKFKVTPRIN